MKSQLQSLLRVALETVLAGSAVAVPETVNLEATKDGKFGDFQTNLALTLAKPLGKPPRAVAEAIVKALPASPIIAKTEIAGPGFINFFLAADAFQSIVNTVLAQGPRYGRDDSGSAGRIMVEFVSANPTGPMHVGHGRNAAYGDALANLLAAAGWTVFREYYVNDAGRQADILTVSVWFRYLELFGESVTVPARAYPGDYVRLNAEGLRARHGERFRRDVAVLKQGLPSEKPDDAAAAEHVVKAVAEKYVDAVIVRMRELLGADYAVMQREALDTQLADIRETLDAFNVRFDRWASERATVDSGAVKKAVQQLADGGHTYEQDGALWLRTTAFGDEKDRVLIKADGAATYFVNDIAYHVDKLARGWPLLLDVWGADHHGYIARMQAAIEALTGNKQALNVQLIQFVTLSSGRMGKRSGNFVTLKDLIAEAGKDATRFFYLSRSHDQHLEFDIELARSQSKENPVYYVQYAHARICRMFRVADERGFAYDAASVPASLHRLTESREKDLLTMIGRYAETIRNAAGQSAPHMMTFYLRDLADTLHSCYDNVRVLVEDDAELRTARLGLAAATRQVIANGLALLGVSAPEQM